MRGPSKLCMRFRADSNLTSHLAEGGKGCTRGSSHAGDMTHREGAGPGPRSAMRPSRWGGPGGRRSPACAIQPVPETEGPTAKGCLSPHTIPSLRYLQAQLVRAAQTSGNTPHAVQQAYRVFLTRVGMGCYERRVGTWQTGQVAWARWQRDGMEAVYATAGWQRAGAQPAHASVDMCPRQVLRGMLALFGRVWGVVHQQGPGWAWRGMAVPTDSQGVA